MFRGESINAFHYAKLMKDVREGSFWYEGRFCWRLFCRVGASPLLTDIKDDGRAINTPFWYIFEWRNVSPIECKKEINSLYSTLRWDSERSCGREENTLKLVYH